MRLAFVIQTHANLEQVRRLLRRLNAGCADRVLVISHNGALDDVRPIAHEQSVDALLSGAASARGRFGLVQSYLDALAWLQKRSTPYDWIVHLSGQDYPVAPLTNLKAHLAATQFDGFFHHFDPFDPDQAGRSPMKWGPHEGIDRYLFHYRLLRAQIGLPMRAAAWLPRNLLAHTSGYRIHTSFGLMLGLRQHAPPFSETLKCYAGSFWQIINRKCVEIILEEDERNRKLREYYQTVMIPDESYLHTILLNRADLLISPSELRYYSFAGQRRGSSKTLEPDDLELLRGRSYFFARKFDMVKHPEMLDAVDDHIRQLAAE
jgi:hypothetical protein